MSVNEQHTDEEHKHDDNGASHEQEDVQVQEETADSTSAFTESSEDARLDELAKQADENHQRFLRVQADFDNFRRRTLKEKEELGQYASMKLIGQLLPVVDNFGRAIEAAKSGGDVESFAKGVDMIFRQLEQVLEQEGLKAMETVGVPFNPDIHQAIMQVESEEHEEGIVVEEVQKGYMLKDKVLRPAMVKVSG
ncbi:nucleotide exchange factor GrpE [Paenibacillus baekrokdamisoli]|uniref:Protein GrpE n=1 Tax=Paenibacillus baekrokdamisoli TaxID=1712516 RepID=A0A3G9IR08_9BACL|nr:nucleotide exchange factor GrpE [Paenibacillus baekrokdamisoli]MBB3070312.1 molecular chaperone GrpE [Paenibacillus baekrokdamisoli]BBH21317.1 nucleotide exchange factor GrpE [Paenibacillus baekrokdamisoli]